MKLIIKLIILGVILIGCSSEGDNLSNPSQIDLVTGINLTNPFGINLGRMGNPNVTLGNGISLVSVFPNPAEDRIDIISNIQLKNVWILKGIPSKNFQDVDFSSILNENLYTKAEISSKAQSMFIDLMNNNLIISLNDYNDGFYRIFIQLEDDTISWSNIYKGSIDGINVW